jgi:hypothetical protein
MTFKDKLSGLAKKVMKHPKKAVLALALAGLVGVTCAKDNVHCGSITLNNPQKNQYVWGLIPRVTVKGDVKGDVYTVGVLNFNHLSEDSEMNGNFNSYGIIGGDSHLWKNSKLTGDMNSYGILGGFNYLHEDSEISGDLRGKGIFVGGVEMSEGVKVTGDVRIRGIISKNNNSTRAFKNTELGIEDYVHHVGDTETGLADKK